MQVELQIVILDENGFATSLEYFSSSLLPLNDRPKKINLTSDAVVLEKSSEIGR